MATNLKGYRSFFNSTVYKVIEEMEAMVADPIFGLAREEAHTTGTGDTVNWTSETFNTYLDIVPPGGDIPETPTVEGDQLARTYFSIKGHMTVEYEAYLHNKLDLQLDKSQELAQSAMNTAALCMCGQILDRADATTQTILGVSQTISCADTLAPASASHTVPGKAGSVYSTIVTNTPALGDVALDTAGQIIKANNVDQAGVNRPTKADLLVIPDNATMIKKAQQLTGSVLSPETANNAISVYSGGSLDFITLSQSPRDGGGAYATADQYNWLLTSRKALKRNMRYRWAANPTNPMEGIFPKFMDKNLDSNIYMIARLVYGLPRWAGMAWSHNTTKPTTT